MSNVQFHLVGTGDVSSIIVVVDGEMYNADNSNPSYDEIVRAAIDGDPRVVDLIDASTSAAAKFVGLTDRVSVSDGRVYVDQTEVDDAFADQIVRFLSEDVEDWKPLVAFLEKVYSNVDADVRENLSRWLKAEAFTLLPNGNILGYRGLNTNMTSRHAGPGIVNGERKNGHLDNSVGNVVEMDRDMVTANPAVGCAPGLHVGTYNYAQGWGPVVVSVEVNPVHVVSVPYECESQKMRVSRYKVVEIVERKTDDAVTSFSGYDYDDDYDEYDEYDDDFGF